MKLHSTLVEKLLTLFEVNSGWPEQRKLREALNKLDLSTYIQQTGNEVLVDTKDLVKHRKDIQEGNK
jgi:hypothetical protein